MHVLTWLERVASLVAKTRLHLPKPVSTQGISSQIEHLATLDLEKCIQSHANVPSLLATIIDNFANLGAWQIRSPNSDRIPPTKLYLLRVLFAWSRYQMGPCFGRKHHQSCNNKNGTQMPQASRSSLGGFASPKRPSSKSNWAISPEILQLICWDVPSRDVW